MVGYPALSGILDSQDHWEAVVTGVLVGTALLANEPSCRGDNCADVGGLGLPFSAGE